MPIDAASGSSLYRGDLSGILEEYQTSVTGFVGLKFLPFFLVDEKLGYFWRLKRATAMGLQSTRLSSEGKSTRVDYKMDQDNYACELHSLETRVPDDKKTEYASQFDLEAVSSKLVMLDLMRAHEKRVADLLLNTTTFPASGDTGLNVSTAWDVTATNTAVDDIMVGKEAIRKRVGAAATDPGSRLVLGLPDLVADKLAISKQVREGLGLRYEPGKGGSAKINDVELAAALGVDEIARAGARYNDANENAAVSILTIWNRQQAFLALVREGNPMEGPSIGRTVAWKEYLGPVTAESYRQPEVKSTIIGVGQSTQEKIFIPECGYRFTGVAS